MPITNAQQARALSRQARGGNDPDVAAIVAATLAKVEAHALSRPMRSIPLLSRPTVPGIMHPLEPADGQPAPTPEQYLSAVSALTALGFTFIEYNGVPWMVW